MGTALEHRWSANEESRLRQWWGRAPVGDIAQKLGRTETAVIVRAKRIGLRTLVNHPDALAEWQIAPMLGVDRKTVWGWMLKGILPVDVIYKRSLPCRVVWRDQLVRWLKEPNNWIYLDPRKVADPELRRVVDNAVAKWGDEWLRSREAADLIGVEHRMINSWTCRGLFPSAIRWGNWWYLRSEVEAVRDLVGKSWRQDD
jgi:predicted DNA-binding transcriptional regulator AlpA